MLISLTRIDDDYDVNDDDYDDNLAMVKNIDFSGCCCLWHLATPNVSVSLQRAVKYQWTILQQTIFII